MNVELDELAIERAAEAMAKLIEDAPDADWPGQFFKSTVAMYRRHAEVVLSAAKGVA